MEDPEYIALIRLVISESRIFPALAQLYSNTVVQYGYGNLSAYFQSHSFLDISALEASTRIFMGTIIKFIISQKTLPGKYTMPMEKKRLIKSLIRCILGESTTEKLTD